jgi:hypothetical protein
MHRASGQAWCFNVAVICAQHIGVRVDDSRPERLGGSSSVGETRPVCSRMTFSETDAMRGIVQNPARPKHHASKT